jgi:hypothetical protein
LKKIRPSFSQFAIPLSSKDAKGRNSELRILISGISNVTFSAKVIIIEPLFIIKKPGKEY